MAGITDSAALGNLDWSKFDFTRWNLSGLSLDPTSSTLATMLQKVMAAPQWPQSFGSNLPALKTAVIQHLTLQTQNLQGRADALDAELSSRTNAAETLVSALQAKIRQSAVPLTLAANPNQVQLVAKALDQQSQLGLPGLTVQLIDPSVPEAPVATAVTDSNGNAILSFSRQKAASLAKDKTGDLTLVVLNSSGTSLYSAANAVSPHPNQVETHIAAIPASGDSAPAVGVATQQAAVDTALLNSLTAKLDQLKVTYAARKTAIQTQIAQIQSTITAIQAELKAP